MGRVKQAKLASNEKIKEVLVGSTVLYIGHPTNHFVCEVCGRKIIKGFLYEEKTKRACSRNCLSQIINN